MFDKDSITMIQESATTYMARQTINEAIKDHAVAALPSDLKVHNLETYMPTRRRARGTMATSMLESFTNYTLEHAGNGASVFIDSETMHAIAVLNIGTPALPGHADNKAKLTLKRTAAFSALIAIATGGGQKQVTVAEFLEDWVGEVSCMNDQGDIATPKAIAAIRKLTIETMRKLESEEQSLSASRSAFESVQATSKEPIPTTILFKCQPYIDLGERTFAIRLGILTGGDKPMISLRVVKAEQHNEEMAEELAALITQGFEGDRTSVYIGAYTRAE